MPNFATTSVERMTCAVVMMGMMKDYFAYKFARRCGIKVMLEGEKKDWEAILQSQASQNYGIQTIAWYYPLIRRSIYEGYRLVLFPPIKTLKNR